MGMIVFLVALIVPFALLFVSGSSQVKYLNQRSDENLKDRSTGAKAAQK